MKYNCHPAKAASTRSPFSRRRNIALLVALPFLIAAGPGGPGSESAADPAGTASPFKAASVPTRSVASTVPAAAVTPAVGAVSAANAFPVVSAVQYSAKPATALPALPAVTGISPRALRMALAAVSCARARGVSGNADLLTIIDYTLPSTTPRFWVLDLAHGKVLFHELVAHGSGSGDNYATRFSDTADSRQTSLGLFLTAGTYEGGNGYSLKLRGLDPGVNERAEQRKIVIHGAWYVSTAQAQRLGRLGRSWGCPALSPQIAHHVIDTIKDGTFVYSYSADHTWLRAATQTACKSPAPAPAPSAPALAPAALVTATVSARLP
ncbi:MAG TPA: murein L,D-transpeptidase catalytic domain family protein [Thermoanaerobaculia bacterium]|nr:murein L,D-transpeptidase catalytic domain family protein [Thermoanaerobaculia bacterium]